MKYSEKWMEWNGFNPDGITFVIYGNSYPIKDTLKDAGYKFCKELGWHGPNPVELPADCGFTKFNIADLVDISGYRNFHYWKENIKEILESNKPNYEIPTIISTSEYLGTHGLRLRDLHAVVKNIRGFDGYYGYSYVYTFDVDGDICTWFTTKQLELDIDDFISLTGTVKKHQDYNGIHQTILNRCIIKAVEELL